MITLGSLFDGIGGWPLAATKFGIDPVWGSEIEPFPQKVTKIRFPEMEHLGDITKINGAKIRPVDIITFGSPCQDLSVAGKRKGLDGERSGLFRTAIDIIRRMREKTNGEYPRFIVWENVPGAFSSNKGADFRTVLEEIAETEIPVPKSNRWTVSGMVRSDSCEIAWRVLDARYWGVPQRRKRIFLVADFRGQCAGEILFKPESVCWYPAESGSKGQGITGSTQNSIGKSSTGIAYSFDSLSSNSMKSGNPHSGCRIVEIAKCLDTTYPDPSKNQGGIGVLQPCICLNDQGGQSINVDYDVSPTLRSESHGNHPCIIHTELSPMDSGNKPAVAILDMTHADEVMRPVKDGIVPTLNARMGTGGNQVPVVQEPVYCIQGSMIGRTDKNGPQGNGINEDVSFTLNTIDRHTVAYCVGNGQLDQAKLSDKVGALNCMHDQQAILSNRTVRRLTPTECERLQGLTDGYTLIDDKKCSDSARYKALGNGMAQPCPDFIMGGISSVFRRDNLG